MLVAAVLSPIIGALADANRQQTGMAGGRRWPGPRRRVLHGAGAAGRCPGSIVALFVLTSLMFELSLGFYNGFLPEIADEQTINRVSAWGYALGYIGGAIAADPGPGGEDLRRRGSACPTSDQLRAGAVHHGGVVGPVHAADDLDPARPRRAARAESALRRGRCRRGLREVGRTIGSVRHYRMLSLFLLGFLFYNDGVQTVISQASTFATMQELSFTTEELIHLILMIQFVALPGAMLVGFVSDRLGQKATLMLCLAIWVGVVATAFFVAHQGRSSGSSASCWRWCWAGRSRSAGPSWA